MPSRIQQGDALLIIDPQRDFCVGGTYPVPDGNAVVPQLSEWLAVQHAGGCVGGRHAPGTESGPE